MICCLVSVPVHVNASNAMCQSHCLWQDYQLKLETCDEVCNFLFSDHVKFLLTGSPNFGSWKGVISAESLAPGPSADFSDYLVLAAHRTKRPDILRAFKPYSGGWNITNNHYWAVSLLFFFVC